MIAESKSEVVIFMYANAKIPEPFCRQTEKSHWAEMPQPAKEPPRTEAAGQKQPHAMQEVSAAETGTSAGQKQPANNQPDNLPLLAFLLMEFFH